MIKVPKPDDTDMYQRRPKGGPRANLMNRQIQMRYPTILS